MANRPALVAALPERVARFGIFGVLLVVVAAAAAVVPEFRTAGNLANVLAQSAALGILAVGQTFVIVCGMIDLSVGQLMGLIVVIACDLMQGRDAYVLPAAAVALAIGCTVGAANGWLATLLRIHPLILTFGMLSILQGAIFVYTDRSVGLAAPALLWLAGGTVLGIPVPALLLVVLAGVGHVVLTGTRFGLRVRAVGAHEENARRAGIEPRRVKLLVYIVSGATAGLAGLILAGRLGTGYPNAGTGFELDAIVAVVLGGASLAGGRGSIPGTLAAVLVLGIASNVLNLMEISAFVQMVVKGAIVILAVLINQPRRVPA